LSALIRAASFRLDIDYYLSYYIDMKEADIADIKNQFSVFIGMVEGGEEIEIRRKNVPVARPVPMRRVRPNRIQPGFGKGSAVYNDE